MDWSTDPTNIGLNMIRNVKKKKIHRQNFEKIAFENPRKKYFSISGVFLKMPLFPQMCIDFNDLNV